MPPNARQAYFALRAFNAEIASIKDSSLLMGRSSRSSDQDLNGIDVSGMSDASLASIENGMVEMGLLKSMMISTIKRVVMQQNLQREYNPYYPRPKIIQP